MSDTFEKRNVIYIWGPRGSGKTTFAKNLFKTNMMTLTSSRSWMLDQRLSRVENLIFEDTCCEDFNLHALLQLMGSVPLEIDGESIKVKNVVIISQYPPERFVDGTLQGEFLSNINTIIDIVLERKRQALEDEQRVSRGYAFPQTVQRPSAQ